MEPYNHPLNCEYETMHTVTNTTRAIKRVAAALLLAAAALLHTGQASAIDAGPEARNAIAAKYTHMQQIVNSGSLLGLVIAFQCTNIAGTGIPQVTPDGLGAFLWFNGVNKSGTCAIYWTRGTGAHFILNTDAFARNNYEKGLGYPVADSTITPDGQSVYTWFSFLSSSGAPQFPSGSAAAYAVPGSPSSFFVGGNIERSWAAFGFERGKGYPLIDTSTNRASSDPCNPWLSGGKKACAAACARGGNAIAWQAFASYGANATQLAPLRCACDCTHQGPGVVWKDVR
ncbi:MAG: hypothetical protein RL385_955 [Pseudomonadota bacterium]